MGWLDGAMPPTHTGVGAGIPGIERFVSIKLDEFRLGERLTELSTATNDIQRSRSLIPQSLSLGCMARVTKKRLRVGIVWTGIEEDFHELSLVLHDRAAVSHCEVDRHRTMLSDNARCGYPAPSALEGAQSLGIASRRGGSLLEMLSVVANEHREFRFQ